MEKRVSDGVKIIRGMTRDEFYYQVIKRLAATSEFSALVVAGPTALLESEKEMLRNDLAAVGVTHQMTETDYDLTEVAVEIASRSVTLR